MEQGVNKTDDRKSNPQALDKIIRVMMKAIKTRRITPGMFIWLKALFHIRRLRNPIFFPQGSQKRAKGHESRPADQDEKLSVTCHFSAYILKYHKPMVTKTSSYLYENLKYKTGSIPFSE